jgi:hypothetical protein
MKTSEANIEIVRIDGKLVSISVIMPTWNKVEHDKGISVNLPLLGIKTWAKNDDDAEIAIEEAIKSVCIVAERFGRGIETELEAIGWSMIHKSDSLALLNFSVESTNTVLEQIMETGDQYAHNFELVEENA